MPSPIGHALGGIAAGWLLQPREAATSPRDRRTATLAFAALGVAADLDLIAGAHRGPTHSLGAAMIVGFVAWGLLRHRTNRAARLAAACAAAYGSHVLLDWLGSDTSPPIGLLALWPFSSAYYEAPWHVFLAVSRRIHQPELFWLPNTLALGRELLILMPAVAFVGYVRGIRPRSLRAIAFAVAMVGAGVAIVQGAGPLSAASAQQSNTYVQAVERYSSGGFDDAVATVADMSEDDIRDQAKELKEDPRTMQAAAMLHTEVAFRSGVDVDAQRATFHLTRAHQLVRDLRRKGAPDEFQRGWFLLASAELQVGKALNVADECLTEARTLFPRDPDVLVAAAAAFELRTFSSSPPPQVHRFSASGQTRTSDPSADVKRALESSARYLIAATAAAPDHDEARLRLGRVLHRLGQVDRAADELDVVRRRASDPGLKYLAALFEGAVESSRHRPERATELFQEALGIKRAQAAFIGLSSAYYDQGRGAEAAGALQAVVRQDLEPDPWLAYLIGDGWHTDARRAAMRALVTRQ